MWPKAFAQFVELAPHISRLLPMADRFFQNKNAGEESTRKAVETMEATSESLRADLGQFTTAHASLSRQIGELDRKLEDFTGDARAAKVAAESLDQRITRIEMMQSRLSMLCVTALVALMAAIVLLGLIYAHVR